MENNPKKEEVLNNLVAKVKNYNDEELDPIVAQFYSYLHFVDAIRQPVRIADADIPHSVSSHISIGLLNILVVEIKRGKDVSEKHKIIKLTQEALDAIPQASYKDIAVSEIFHLYDYQKIYIRSLKQRKELAQIVSELSALNIFPSHHYFFTVPQ